MSKTLNEAKELEDAAMPLIKYLNENHNPHTIAIVSPTSVEILVGTMTINKIYKHLKD